MSYAADGPLDPPWVNDKYDCECDVYCDMCSDDQCECYYHKQED